jgi:redox-sensitive bicupin YhaK (pirin superfamily)
MGVKSEIRNLTPVFYLDFTVEPGSQFYQPIAPGWTTFAYTLEGNIKFGND